MTDYMNAVQDTIDQHGAERRLTDQIRDEHRRRISVRAVAVLAAAAAAVAIVIVAGSGDTGDDRRTTPLDRPPKFLPFGTVPAGFPTGRFEHPGYLGLTSLNLTRDGNAVIDDPVNSSPLTMRMRFRTPNSVEFTVTQMIGGRGQKASVRDCGTPALYTYTLTQTQLTFYSSYAADPCSERRIRLTEKPWDLK
jgi:hypothetical protein